MQIKTLAAHSSLISIPIPNFRYHSPSSISFSDPSLRSLINGRRSRSSLRHLAPEIRWNCIGQNQELFGSEAIEAEYENNLAKPTSFKEEEEDSLQPEVNDIGGLENRSIWNQVKEIVMFTGPATGLWLCGPLMSFIDTAVIGQGSSIELAALGPGTVLCDYVSYVFMFLSVATSNMVATSLARQDKNEVQHQISTLLFVGLTCGASMLVFTKLFGSWTLSGNKHW
uniref:Protein DETOXIFICATION Multidrug and toxic compound extrusion protein n=1 Tax=Rhizophora mucronata TaxID=61149 RepID=A0A2P2L1X5_RHIMU